MSDYNKYVEAVNKIYELAAKMRVSYPDQDNLSLLESIEENKQIVISNAKLFNNAEPPKQNTHQSTPPQTPVTGKTEA